MKQRIYKMLLTIAVVVTAHSSFAQYALNQVIVLNQGPYGGPVTVGSYNPTTKLYQNFDSLPQLRFASDVIIDSGYIYVAADSFLIKYDLNTKQRLAVTTVQGIREIAVWGNELLVTRGQTYPLPSYFQAYSKSSLSLIYSLSSVSAATEGIKVLNDTAYVAINGFVEDIGKLAVIDLNKQVENREINLGSSGYNPYNVEVENTGKAIYTVNNLDFDSMSITKYSPAIGTFTTIVVNQSSSCNGSTYYLNNIYFQVTSRSNVQVFSTSGSSVWDSLNINKSLLGVGIDSANAFLYIGNTDYVTYGKVFIYDLFGNSIDSFNVNVSPGNFAFDIRSTSGINQVSSFVNLVMYPNPVANQLHVTLIDSKDAQANLTLVDILGRQVYQQQIPTNAATIVPVNSLAPGIYFLKVQTANGELTRKIVKE